LFEVKIIRLSSFVGKNGRLEELIIEFEPSGYG